MMQPLATTALAALMVLAASTQTPAEAPPEFADCKLGDVTGAGMTISSYACGPERGNIQLVADEALPGFVEVTSGPDGESKTVRVRAFKKEPGEPIDAVLPAVRAASPGPHSAECTFEPLDAEDTAEPKRYVFAPTGDSKAAWAAAQDSGGEIDPPCGDLGEQFVGDLYFQELPGDPSTVVFVNAGSEIQIFDPTSLKSIKAK